MRRLLNALASLRLTVGLLLSLGLLFLAGLAIPQRSVLSRRLYEDWRRGSPTLVGLLELAGLTDVFRSPLAFGLWTLFFLNLAVVMTRRIPVTLDRVRVDRPIAPPCAPGFGRTRAVELGGGRGISELAGWLAARRLAVHVEGARLRAVRHRLAPVATLLFHLSFFLVAAGGIASYVTRFQGVVELGEGEEFTGDLGQYKTPPRLPRVGVPPEVRFRVEEILPEFSGDTPVRLRIKVRTPDFDAHFIEVNRPYEVGRTIFVFRDLGVAPGLLLQAPDGAVRFAGFMRLDLLGGKVDRFELLGLKLEVELFPEYFREGGSEGSRSQEMRDPVLRVTGAAPSGAKVVSYLRPGEAMALGPYSLTFKEWRYWARLVVRSERGLGVVWTGFGLAALALVWRLWFYRREFVFEVGEGGTVTMSGRADYYRALLEDEVEALAQRLERELGRGEPRTSA